MIRSQLNKSLNACPEFRVLVSFLDIFHQFRKFLCIRQGFLFHIANLSQTKYINVLFRRNKDLKYILHKIETKVIVHSQTFLKGAERVTEKVTENQKEIMKLIKQNKFATVIEIADLIKISRKSVLENISKLKQKGLLKRICPDKGGYWELVK